MQTDKKPIYPVEPWTITEKEFRKEYNYRNETTFALSNGYIGTRGTYEEGYPFDIDTGLEGNFVNGFYESEHIRYGEANFGSPLLSQSLLNLPNLKETKLFLEGEEFSMMDGTVEAYSRTLHMKDGVLERSLVWTSPMGKRVRIRIRRLVSFAMKNIMAIRYEVTPLNFHGEIRFTSRLQADVENHTRKTNPIVDYGPFGRRLERQYLDADGAGIYYQGTTMGSHLSMACGSHHQLWANGENVTARSTEKVEKKELEAQLYFKIQGEKDVPVTMEKMIAYTTVLDQPEDEMLDFVKKTLKEAEAAGYESLEEKQKAYMHDFWKVGDISLTGEESKELIQGLHFNLFHIFQAAGRDGKTGEGAKGLSGEGYEGHYFWDTEMYMLPVFVYTQPEVARSLLEYRYGTLDKARARARILGHEKGALYPWRTINGEEASTYYPLGSAQYHINADIAYALSLYLQVTGDKKFFLEKGAEMLLETARIWADVGSFAPCKGGKYCICDVTGPDEYNVLVDNNFYTNLMAREHLCDAVKAVEYLRNEEPETGRHLAQKLSLDPLEVKEWEKIVEQMYFPYDEERQIYPMDDGFMMRKPWDESKIPPQKRAWLYENYHPLFIMRHRMSKQADAILGMYLHSHLFTEEELKRNYDFYQEVTLHHSSLSTCIFGIVADSIGRYEEAYRYFSQSARMDLDDYHNNFYAGIHAANMGGTWQAIVNGFAGLRCFENHLHFQPHLPEKWEHCAFHLRFRDCVLRVEMYRNLVRFVLEQGDEMTFFVKEKEVRLTGCGGSYEEEV